MRILPTVVAAVGALCAGGCFTGIESTPRISESEVRQAGAEQSAEQRFMAPVRPEPPAEWRPGKEWAVADERIALIFTAASARPDSLRGSVIRLARTSAYTGVAGDTLVELAFTTASGGDSLFYRPGVTARDLASRRGLDIPFAVELSAVYTADSLLRGRTLYITTPNWLGPDGRPADGLRHVPVRVTGVEAGTEQYPLRVMFADSAGTVASVLMTYGGGPAATRNFDRTFAFDDPRRRYPRITARTWDLIVHSRVAEGMTRDECRLALGAPASIDRAGTNAGQYERWNYDQGIYLIFEDGILIRFRQ